MKLKDLLKKAEKIVSEKLEFNKVEFKLCNHGNCMTASFEVVHNEFYQFSTKAIRYESTHDARLLLELLRVEVLRISNESKTKNTDITL